MNKRDIIAIVVGFVAIIIGFILQVNVTLDPSTMVVTGVIKQTKTISNQSVPDDIYGKNELKFNDIIQDAIIARGGFSAFFPNADGKKQPIYSVKANQQKTLWASIIILLGSMLAGQAVRQWYSNFREEKAVEELDDDIFERRMTEICRHHGWLLNYGLAKIPKDGSDIPMAHYTFSLNLMIDGYRDAFKRRNKVSPSEGRPIHVTLFFPGTRESLRQLQLDPNFSATVSEFFEIWNEKARDEAYEIKRAFVCERTLFDAESEDALTWYSRTFPQIPAVNINKSDAAVNKVLNKLEDGKDLDFVIFQGAEKEICVGLINNRFMYVVMNRDEVSVRGELLSVMRP